MSKIKILVSLWDMSIPTLHVIWVVLLDYNVVCLDLVVGIKIAKLLEPGWAKTEWRNVKKEQQCMHKRWVRVSQVRSLRQSTYLLFLT